MGGLKSPPPPPDYSTYAPADFDRAIGSLQQREARGSSGFGQALGLVQQHQELLRQRAKYAPRQLNYPPGTPPAANPAGKPSSF